MEVHSRDDDMVNDAYLAYLLCTRTYDNITKIMALMVGEAEMGIERRGRCLAFYPPPFPCY
jgi:hypothetical protein